LKNSGGFLKKDVNLEEVAKYVAELPAYRRVKKKIEFLRSRIKRITSEKVKFYLKDKLRQLIDEKKKIIAVAFYEKHGHKAAVTFMAINKARKLRSKNIGKKNKSLLGRCYESKETRNH